MNIINAFSELTINNFQVINMACVALLPKKDGADNISDFRPISLIHMIPKIIAKAMALRLCSKMNEITSISQSVFIKSKSDNFMYVRNVAATSSKPHAGSACQA